MPERQVKGYKGAGMEGFIARWYAKTRGNDMEDFRRQARAVAERLPGGSRVLEVAPGPGFFAVELAKLGEVLAHQREVVPVVKAADRPYPGHAVPVAELAPERVAGVRRVGNHAACAHDAGDRDDRAPLRIGRMDVEVPGHATSLRVGMPVSGGTVPAAPQHWTRAIWTFCPIS